MPGTRPEGEYVLSFGDFLALVRRRLWIIALVTILLVGAAVGFSLQQTPVYEGSIKILVGQEGDPTSLASEVPGLQQLTQTMAELVNTRPVAESVIQQLNLRVTPEDFLANLSVQQISSTQAIEVSYRDSSPERAAEAANTVGDVFANRLSELSPGTSAITATVWEQAAIPEEPVSPNPVRNGLLALVAGLILGVGLAFLLDYFDDSWQSPEDAEQISGVPTFGIIPELPRKSKGKGKSREVNKATRNEKKEA